MYYNQRQAPWEAPHPVLGKNRQVPSRDSKISLRDCQGELLGTLLYLVGNEQDARDALQDTFVKCWKHRQKNGGIQNLKAWVFRVAMNTARDIRKTAWRRRRQPMPLGAAELLPGAAIDAADALVADEEIRQLKAALQALRPEEKEVFLLRQNGDLTYEEISQLLELPTGTVKTRMRMAVQRLRFVLKT